MPTVSSSEPSLATGARSTTGPDEIVLAFSEPIDGRPHISLRTATGTQINLAFGSTDPGDTCVHANIPTLAATSTLPPVETLARDGQTTEGESAFAAGTDLPVAISTRTHPKGRFGWADVLIEFELVAALAVVFGCLASERLTPLSAGR